MKRHYKVEEARQAAREAIAKYEAQKAQQTQPVLRLVINNKLPASK